MQANVPDRYPTQQLHLSLFSPHEIAAWEQEEERSQRIFGAPAPSPFGWCAAGY